ncbi:hypothetical protein pneo_cds_675 [Pandoravirus neocaledonia]|uniref:Uncharacterized protein n=1 Tax=Pandoravirus neocaledonia TaxID=2107708 RepID=A0A2U7UD07_9VIRU|nr:hypothetical protein pneo_cds_675 [Pandoravirus neocaledonia]AVK76282.1 hypothetical protein pneo_cds_675 [Pandoravirus neocaledonia]
MDGGRAVSADEASLRAHKATLAAAVQGVLARGRRHARVHQVLAKLRRRGDLDTAVWAESLQEHELHAVLSTLWIVHTVIDKGPVAEATIVPATLGWPPGSQGGEIDARRWGPPSAPWVRRSRVLVHTATQCRDAVADLRTRLFVSVVIDASPEHDLGLVHVAALGDKHRPARCYTFDVCATPMAEWNGGAHLFDSGGLARFLGDPAIPKAVCGLGPTHDRAAHVLARHLRRSFKPRAHAAAIQDRQGGHNLLVRNTVRVLPVNGDDDDNMDAARAVVAVRASLRAHMLDTDAWRAAGSAPRGDRWYWVRRPLSSRTLDNCAERAFTLCAAYDALASATSLVAMSVPVTDSLLCIAAAQTAASTNWPDGAGPRERLHCDRRPAANAALLASDAQKRATANNDSHHKDGIVVGAGTTRCATAQDIDRKCRTDAVPCADDDTNVRVDQYTKNGAGSGDDGGGSAAVVAAEDVDNDTKDWEEICRAVDVYTSDRADACEMDDDGTQNERIAYPTDGKVDDNRCSADRGAWATIENVFRATPS